MQIIPLIHASFLLSLKIIFIHPVQQMEDLMEGFGVLFQVILTLSLCGYTASLQVSKTDNGSNQTKHGCNLNPSFVKKRQALGRRIV